jgi:hypothetical protein
MAGLKWCKVKLIRGAAQKYKGSANIDGYVESGDCDTVGADRVLKAFNSDCSWLVMLLSAQSLPMLLPFLE